MSSDLRFGEHVLVAHTLKAIYARCTTEHFVPAGGGRFMLRDDGPERWEATDHWNYPKSEIHDDGLPGLPLPEPSVLPAGARQVRRTLRRFPVQRAGVVVGRTYRMEGQYHQGMGYSFMDGESEPPYLAESRRMWVYQVALRQPSDNGKPADASGHPWPALLVDVLPDDVTRSPF